MSKHETWRTRQYWESVGGLLIEEYVIVPQTKEQARRTIDGLIILNEEKQRLSRVSYDIEDKDVIVIQTKKRAIGMNLLGQAYFSKLLVEWLKPKSVKSVAICGKNDAAMAKLAKQHGVEIVVIPESDKPAQEA